MWPTDGCQCVPPSSGQRRHERRQHHRARAPVCARWRRARDHYYAASAATFWSRPITPVAILVDSPQPSLGLFWGCGEANQGSRPAERMQRCAIVLFRKIGMCLVSLRGQCGKRPCLPQLTDVFHKLIASQQRHSPVPWIL